MKTLLLVDGTSYLYRAFHAMAPLTSPTGEPTGALYGVLNMLRHLRLNHQHDYCACIFDAKGKNFRHQLYPEYKSTRPPMPDELRSQANQIQELVALTGWPVISIADVEADDVIGTLAREGEKAGLKVIISTGDKDMAQLVTDNITLVNTMKNEILDIAGVQEKFGVPPNRIIDYLTLIGDKVDNVPGVDKCGPKTAVKWLDAYDSLQGVMNHASEIKGKVGEHLQAALEHLPLSYELITIKDDVDLTQALPNGLTDLHFNADNLPTLLEKFEALGFKKWLEETKKKISDSSSSSKPQADLFGDSEKASNTNKQPASQTIDASQYDYSVITNYQAVTTTEALNQLIERLKIAQEIGLDTETTSLNVQEAKIIGLSMAFAPGDAIYIPLAHHATLGEEQLPLKETLDTLKPYLESATLGKIGQNIKYDQHIFANHGIRLAGITGDSMLASYIVESHLGHSLDELAERHLGISTITYESLCGKGAKQLSFADIDIPNATQYASQDADLALRLHLLLLEHMDAEQKKIYLELELPLSQVLFEMERHGVLIDKPELDKQSHHLGTELLAFEQQAYELAGQPFNLNSPKQLQEILFNKLEIPTKGLKKTPSGGISTNESVLEKLALDYPLPKIILQTRSISKLKSTYTDKLPTLINPTTGRVHTTYAQAVAITGRLASNNPNLQNIPIRTEDGRRVRRAFIAPEGYQIVSADYSQVELRIMAHLSQDSNLIDAFNHGQDIHRRTAAEIFSLPQDEVTNEQRRYAKTINFGLIYGMREYGLAQALETTPFEAKEYIDRYFARYPGVAQYMQRAKENAEENGYVETIFGRRLYLPDIHNKNGNIRAGAERAAINAPMQGTASDLIKRAMLAVQNWLKTNKLKSTLIMQVHDELILEVPEAELTLIQTKLPELMSQAGQLLVPLLAEVGTGKNWEQAH